MNKNYTFGLNVFADTFSLTPSERAARAVQSMQNH